MPRQKAQDFEEDEDYDPYDSFDDSRNVRQRGESDSGKMVVRSSRGRPVKARQYSEETDTEDEELRDSRRSAPRPVSKGRQNDFAHMFDDDYSRPPPQQRAKPAIRRQRWVPHNPLIMGGFEEDDDSKDPQISDDDDESEGDCAGRARRKVPEGRSKGGSVPVRDEAGKFIGVRPQTAAERRQLQTTSSGVRGSGGGGIFKTAAVTVLREERRLMSTGEIARIALKRGYIKVQGRTPEATMASAMYTDVKRKADRSTFIRPHEGLFGLREWLDEGVNFKDPVEDKFPDETTQAVLRRNKISASQQLTRANSRGSGAGHRGRSRGNSPSDPFLPGPAQGQGPSNRVDPIFERGDFPSDLPGMVNNRDPEDISIGLPPRLAAGLPGLEPKGLSASRNYQAPPPASTPFGGNRGGPPLEIFKSRFAEGSGRGGFVPTGKRSLSGSQLTAFHAPQRANSAGRKQRKPGPNMTQQDSGNMMLLLSAVEGVKSMEKPNDGKRQGFPQRASGLPGPGLERRPGGSGALKRDTIDNDRVPQLTLQGFNASRIAAVQATGAPNSVLTQADQVNILNLPLPDNSNEKGSMDGPEEPPPGADVDPSQVTAGPSAAIRSDAMPPHPAEAALQALDSAFARAPLQLSGSLSGPLAPAIRLPSASGPQEVPPMSSAAGSSVTLADPVTAAQTILPNMAQQQIGPMAQPQLNDQQMPRAGGLPMAGTGTMPGFGTPEMGAKRLPEVEAAVRAMEGTLGDRHPKVGKGYLYLSRVYQCLATPKCPEFYVKAQQALHHAYEICFACQKPGK